MKLSNFFGRFFGHTKHPQTIDRAELREILQKIKSATIISLEATTVPRTKVEGVEKRQKVVGIIRWTYKNAVNNRRYIEGKRPNFEPELRKWGQRVGTLIEHNSKWYCEVKIERVCWEGYTIHGQPISKEDAGVVDRVEGKRQELEKPVIVRDFALDSITKIKLLGKEFIVKEKLTRKKKKLFNQISKLETRNARQSSLSRNRRIH